MYRFGPFELDGGRRVLSRNGQAVGVRAKAVELLLILVQHQGEPVSKEELLNRLWPDTEVCEHNLTVTIAALRKAFGEKSGENLFIATLPGRGYAFVAELSDSRGTAQVWRRAGWIGVLAVTAALAIAIVKIGVPPRNIAKTSMLTSTGVTSIAALSPDGKKIAYVSGTADEEELVLSDVGGGSARQLLGKASMRYSSIAFTPDGQAIVFVAQGEDEDVSSLNSVRLQDGSVSRVAANVHSASISPDGTWVAFAREDLQQGKSYMVVSRVGSKEERVIAVRTLPAQLEYPAWAPDGKRIACVETTVKGGARSSSVIELGLDGSEKQIAKNPFNRVYALHWNRQDGSLLASARDHQSGIVRLWSIAPASGSLRPLTEELNSMVGVGSDLSGRVVTVQQRLITAVWVAEAGKWNQARRVLFSDTAIGRSAWMKGGSLLVERDFGGTAAFGVLDLEKLTIKPLLAGVAQGWMPTVCADGEEFYFRSKSSRGEGEAIWRSDIRGARPVEVTSPLNFATLSCGNDAYYAEFNSAERIGIWRLPRQGGGAVRLSAHKALWPQLSPDGRWLAAFYSNSDKPNDRRPENLAVLPAVGGEPVKKFSLPSTAEVLPGLAWDADSRGLYFVQNRGGAGGIWFQRLSGGEAARIIDFPGERITHFAWSPDWKRLVLSRAAVSQDAVLLEGVGR